MSCAVKFSESPLDVKEVFFDLPARQARGIVSPSEWTVGSCDVNMHALQPSR